MRGQGCHHPAFYRTAGTSFRLRPLRFGSSDHPRGCGDKLLKFFLVTAIYGSPPRMRGQASPFQQGDSLHGITPADAGTSWQVLRLQPLPPDHPRGCGDKCDWMAFFISSCGSPPRMRGQDTWVSMDCHTPRITPADAGTRALMREGLNEMKDHPRGCGDKNYFSINFYWFIGSPPRMRGQVIPPGLSLSRCWITPADAGTSCHNQATVTFLGDHPRGCGDKTWYPNGVVPPRGSPPRMRGQAQLVKDS